MPGSWAAVETARPMAGRSAPYHPAGLPTPLALYLAAIADRAVERAVAGWRRGIPRYELALMNRVTEPFNGLSLTRADPFGYLGTYLRVSSELYQLHGRGGMVPGQPKGSDAYGADLAVTVDVRSHLRKTAFLQFKRTDRSSVEVEAKQLRQASRYGTVWERSFFAVADERKAAWPPGIEMLVAKSADVQALAASSASGGTVSLTDPAWHPTAVWLVDWLRCEVGPPTLPGDPDPVEDRLERFAEAIGAAEGEDAFVAREQFPEFARLQGWLRLGLTTSET